MNPCEEFIKYWEELDLSGPSYVHPQDRHWLLQEKHNGKVTLTAPETPREWVNERRGSKFQLGLLPMPYCGDLRNADIIICLLNPGLSPADFYAEKQELFHDRLVKNIKQDAVSVAQYPFMFLDPQWCWTAGYDWWARKLDGTIAEAANVLKYDWVEASQQLSTRMAVIELFPYHSRIFSLGAAHKKMPSCIAAKKFVHSLINDTNKTIIVMRQRNAWGLGELANRNCELIIYKDGEERGAHLSPNSKGGKAILKRLLGGNPLV